MFFFTWTKPGDNQDFLAKNWEPWIQYCAYGEISATAYPYVQLRMMMLWQPRTHSYTQTMFPIEYLNSSFAYLVAVCRTLSEIQSTRLSYLI